MSTCYLIARKIDETRYIAEDINTPMFKEYLEQCDVTVDEDFRATGADGTVYAILDCGEEDNYGDSACSGFTRYGLMEAEPLVELVVPYLDNFGLCLISENDEAFNLLVGYVDCSKEATA